MGSQLKDEQIPFARWSEAILEQFLGKNNDEWHQDYKLYVGSAIVAFVLLDGFLKIVDLGPNGLALFKCIEIFGIDLVCLHFMQYHPTNWLFMCVGLSIGYLLFWTLKGIYVASKKRRVNFRGDNVYLDFSQTAFAKTLLIFVGQLALTKLLVNSAMTVVDRMEMSYIYWLTAFISVQVTCIFGRGIDSQVGSAFKSGTWGYLLPNACQMCLQAEGDAKPFRPSPPNVWARGIMSFIINGVVRDSIGYITPILLMGSSSDLEFVQNALAILFIPTLDDKGDGKEYTILSLASDAPEGGRGPFSSLSLVETSEAPHV